MRIELVDLEDGKGEFAHVYQPAELDLGDERVSLCAPASVSGKVRQAGYEVFVNGKVDACVQVDCDRCLKPVTLPVKSDFSLEYITGSEYESNRTVELTEDLMSVSVFDGESLDVDEITKEQVLLLVPTRLLCKEDCQGFCPTCGADKNAGDCSCTEVEIDPRWAALKNLMNGKS
ncbi:MAG TPA: DUF177 domain-containing protein [Pyrinomonadaceae bacterium]